MFRRHLPQAVDDDELEPGRRFPNVAGDELAPEALASDLGMHLVYSFLRAASRPLSTRPPRRMSRSDDRKQDDRAPPAPDPLADGYHDGDHHEVEDRGHQPTIQGEANRGSRDQNPG